MEHRRFILEILHYAQDELDVLAYVFQSIAKDVFLKRLSPPKTGS
jgi:hypothetical protein